jgi:hypothetical protein
MRDAMPLDLAAVQRIQARTTASTRGMRNHHRARRFLATLSGESRDDSTVVGGGLLWVDWPRLTARFEIVVGTSAESTGGSESSSGEVTSVEGALSGVDSAATSREATEGREGAGAGGVDEALSSRGVAALSAFKRTSRWSSSPLLVTTR